MTLGELSFPAMGTWVRLLGSPGAPLEAARALIEDLEARLTRFDPESELCRLNADPREVVPASPELRAAVRAALDGAAATGGLADPTLLGALVDAGYARSLTGRPRADLREALAAAPRRAPRRPRRAKRGGSSASATTRSSGPPGVRLDLGGSAKGHAADLAAAHARAATGRARPTSAATCACAAPTRFRCSTRSTGRSAATLLLDGDAVATSGIDRRLWWDAGGRPAHHLLDPATNRPAWTGVLTATAKAPTAARAEALAKAAVLVRPRPRPRDPGRPGRRADRVRRRGPRDRGIGWRRFRGGIRWRGFLRGAEGHGGRDRRGGAMSGRDPLEFGLVAREPGFGHRRARPDRRLGDDRARDGREGVPEAGLPRMLIAVHEHAALAALVAIAVHGLTLLGDAFLHPGLAGIAVPFVIDHEPVFTGLGIIGGYLAAILGLTFYIRRRVGTRRWRNLHRLTPLVYVLGVTHTLGSGTDAGTPWMTAILIATGTPILYFGILRALPAAPSPRVARAGSG